MPKTTVNTGNVAEIKKFVVPLFYTIYKNKLKIN